MALAVEESAVCPQYFRSRRKADSSLRFGVTRILSGTAGLGMTRLGTTGFGMNMLDATFWGRAESDVGEKLAQPL